MAEPVSTALKAGNGWLLVRHLAADISTWVQAGLPLAADAEINRRQAICNACERWLPHPVPHCSICGCTTAKTWLATSACPLGTW